MPYIENRKEVNARIRFLEGPYPIGRWCDNSGELNYVLTLIIHGYVQEHGLCYKTLNEVIGVLECAGQEFYRKVVVPYEDLKRLKNGPVSELDI